MKVLLLLLSSIVLLFASTPQERENKLLRVVDMNISNTLRVEKRISLINAELEKKALKRLEKDKLREAKLKKLDERLQKQAQARDKASR